MSNVKTSIEEMRLLMRPTMASAVMALIGGEPLQLHSPNVSSKERKRMSGTIRDVPEGLLGFGSSVISIMANGYYRLVYAHFVDQRCRELFGFGLTMEGDYVVLKRPESKRTSSAMGYGYYKDGQGRDMIIGDYAYELNNAYMRLIDTPEFVHRNPGGHDYVYVNTAKIYIADLLVTAAWCGDEVVITNGYVRIEGAKEKE